MFLEYILTACVKEPVDDGAQSRDEIETDILIIGAGGAGLMAAYLAKDAGYDVILLEKRVFTGGNSIVAGKFDAGDSNFNAEMDVNYSAKDRHEDVFDEVGQVTDEVDADFVRNFTSKGGEIIDWLYNDVKVPIGKIINDKEIYAPEGSDQKLTI